ARGMLEKDPVRGPARHDESVVASIALRLERGMEVRIEALCPERMSFVHPSYRFVKEGDRNGKALAVGSGAPFEQVLDSEVRIEEPRFRVGPTQVRPWRDEDAQCIHARRSSGDDARLVAPTLFRLEPRRQLVLDEDEEMPAAR